MPYVESLTDARTISRGLFQRPHHIFPPASARPGDFRRAILEIRQLLQPGNARCVEKNVFADEQPQVPAGFGFRSNSSNTRSASSMLKPCFTVK